MGEPVRELDADPALLTETKEGRERIGPQMPEPLLVLALAHGL
jgi:hypothetical protein